MSDYQGLVTKDWIRKLAREIVEVLPASACNEGLIETLGVSEAALQLECEVAEVIARNVQPSPEPDKDVANLLTNICQILDVVKLEWGAENCWSPWDQEQRDRVTEYLRKHYAAREACPVQQPAPTFAATTQNCDCETSSGICGSITRGTGKLDDNGYWEFECPHGNAFTAYDPKQFVAPVQQPATEPDKFVMWVREDISEVDWLRQKLNEEVKYGIAADKKIEKLNAALALRDVPQGHSDDLEKVFGEALASAPKSTSWIGYVKHGVEVALAARQVPVGPEGKKC